MHVWRIAVDAPEYEADDLSGKGAEITGGRWNRAGTPVVYCASSLSLAAMETYVHLGAGDLPLNRFVVKIEIPDDIWSQRVTAEVSDLPVGWSAIPPGKISLDVGELWLTVMESAILELPSVIVPEESCILINPKHPDAARITAVKLRAMSYDARLKK